VSGIPPMACTQGHEGYFAMMTVCYVSNNVASHSANYNRFIGLRPVYSSGKFT